MDSSQERVRHYLQETLDRSGLTSTQLARRAGLAPSTLNRFLNRRDVKHVLSARTLMRIAAVTEQTGGAAKPLTDMASRSPAHNSPAHNAPAHDSPAHDIDGIIQNLRSTKHADPAAQAASMAVTAHVPVYGITAGADGWLDMTGPAIDQAGRPHSLQGVWQGYAVYMIGDSMEPKYETGQTLYVHPNRPARVLDYVVVTFTNGRATVRRLIKRDTRKILLRQFNPIREQEFSTLVVQHIHRIVTVDESH